MQSKFKLSVKARADIKKLFRYSFQQFGVNQAIKYKTGLEDCFQLLADNPDMGRKCDDTRKDYHRHEYERHIIFYRKRTHDIFITAIIYNGKDLKHIFSVTAKWLD